MSAYTGLDARARYVQDSVGTASPGRLLVMLYDRLVLDLVRADAALLAADRQSAHDALMHAQAIVSELRTSLKHDAGWDGSHTLAAIYTWLAAQLVQANVNGDRDRIESCRGVVEPLRESWHEALAEVGDGSSDDQRRAG